MTIGKMDMVLVKPMINHPGEVMTEADLVVLVAEIGRVQTMVVAEIGRVPTMVVAEIGQVLALVVVEIG